MAFVEENEVSVNSQGGTEITKRSIGKYIPEELAEDFQIIPSRIRDLKEDKIRLYWAHDLPEDPECSKFADENFRNKFHKIVFSSHWQMNEFITKLRIPFSSKLEVIETPIEPFELVDKPKDKIRLIYFSTPHRGLDILVPVFKHLCEKHNDIHLDVFSSFKIYGWEEADKQFEPLYDEIRNHPQMTYHGFAQQDELRKAVQQAHILAYPSIFAETSCLTAIEAGAAGCKIVTTDYGALRETCQDWATYVDFTTNRQELVNNYAETLKKEIDNYTPECYNTQSKWFNDNYSWLNRANEWNHFFNNICK